MFTLPRRTLSFVTLFSLLTIGVLQAQELQPLKYNNPGLTVDLGVGLWAWPVPADADGDGDYDLFVSCPDKPSNGVWLFENTTGDTKQNPFPTFAPGKKISKTTHYVMPSYTQDGLRVLTPGAEYPSFIYHGLDNREPLSLKNDFYQLVGDQPKGPKVRHNQWRYCDFDGDDDLDLIIGIEDWSEYGWDDAWDMAGNWKNGKLHGFVFVSFNEGSDTEPDYQDPIHILADGSPIDVYGCPSPNFEDFDADGDLDLICGEFLDRFTYFENIGSREQPRYASGKKLLDEIGAPLKMELQMIVPIAFDWDRDGDFDLIVGDEDGRVAWVENTGKLDENRLPQFKMPRYFQQQADELKCGALATPYCVDWDSDGDLDIISGNTAGFVEFFENLSGPNVENPKWAAPVRLMAGDEVCRIQAGPNGSIQGPAEAKWGYTTITVADWNHDGLNDLLTNGIWGKIEWLQNIGTKTEPKLAAPQPIEVDWKDDVPKPAWIWWTPTGDSLVTQWRTTPIAIDWTDDGLTDLVVLDQEGFLSLFERKEVDGEYRLLPPQRVFYGENFSATDGKQKITNQNTGPIQLNSRSAGASGRRKLCIVDWDGDGKRDILVNSISANLLLQTRSEDGKWYFEDKGALTKQSIQGHTTSPAIVDFNGDSKPDFLGGAEDGRFYYMRHPDSMTDTDRENE